MLYDYALHGECVVNTSTSFAVLLNTSIFQVALASVVQNNSTIASRNVTSKTNLAYGFGDSWAL